MKKVTYDASTKIFTVEKSLFSSGENFPLTDIEAVKIGSMATFFDEIGIIVRTKEDSYFLKEWDTGFFELISALGLPSKLGPNWYNAVERGKVFELQIK